MPLKTFAADLLEAGGNLFFPPVCTVCQTALPEATRRFCGKCLAAILQLAPAHRCQRCSAPVGPHLTTEQGCVHCKQDSYKFQRVFSLGFYDGLLREACLHGKQSAGGPVIFSLTQLLCEEQGEQLSRLNVDCIIPVPHFWADRLLQFHLPPETIAQQLSRFLKVPIERHILKKIRRTPKQAMLSPSDRRKNLRKAFQVKSETQLQGKNILLVDDILTTGTTAIRTSQVLRKAGAAIINVAVIARGIGA